MHSWQCKSIYQWVFINYQDYIIWLYLCPLLTHVMMSYWAGWVLKFISLLDCNQPLVGLVGSMVALKYSGWGMSWRRTSLSGWIYTSVVPSTVTWLPRLALSLVAMSASVILAFNWVEFTEFLVGMDSASLQQPTCSFGLGGLFDLCLLGTCLLVNVQQWSDQASHWMPYVFCSFSCWCLCVILMTIHGDNLKILMADTFCLFCYLYSVCFLLWL